MVACFVDIG